jgi:sulfate/thiosulfate transport system permease protein
VVGLALVLVYSGRTGWLGQSLEQAGLQVIYAPPGIIMATAFVSLPLVIREVVPVLQEIGTEQEQAARSLGASGLQTFVRITLPAIKWGLIYGVVLSLARSLGEFGAVKIVSGGVAMRTQTATLLVEERYQQFGVVNSITAYTAAFILALIAVIALIIVTSLRPPRETS